MSLEIIQGDWIERLRELPDESVQCCVTSPPYWGLRDYGVAGQLGLEKILQEYVAKLVAGFREVRRVLKKDGTLWLNLGDTYNANGREGHGTRVGLKQGTNRGSAILDQKCFRGSTDSLKPKDLIGIAWRVAFALQADGWWLRSDIIWAKPNPMPESVRDRPTRSHEYLFLMAKSERYYYDADAIAEPAGVSMMQRLLQPNFENQTGGPKDSGNGNRSHRKVIENLKRKIDNRKPFCPGQVDNRGDGHDRGGGTERTNGLRDACMRNKRTVWTVSPAQYPDAHFATFPRDLIKPCILAGSRPGDTVLDPFFGSGTTGMVALELGRKCVGIELNEKYIELARGRCNVTVGLPL